MLNISDPAFDEQSDKLKSKKQTGRIYISVVHNLCLLFFMHSI